jgi:MFS transporter, DHA2 family, multidrug resistance protein
VCLAFFCQRTGDSVPSRRMAVQVLAAVRGQQASSLACFDCFWVLAVVALSISFLVYVIKRSVAEKGTHISQE